MKLHYIDSLRVIATILVIVIHTSSMFISSQGLTTSDEAFLPYYATHVISSFAVAVFFLISGALLLDPEKEISYQKIFRRYIPRIVYALVIFGLPMCFIEHFLSQSNASITSIVLNSILNLLTGNCWTHMWYLYMLLGLYLLVPLFKAFISNTSKRDLEYLIVSLLLLGTLIPSIKDYFGIQIASYLNISAFIALFPLEYYLKKYTDSSKWFVISLITIITYIVICIYKAKTGNQFVGPYTFTSAMAASALFIIFKKYTLFKKLSDNLSKHCFCIYIIHAVLLNILFKFVHAENRLQFSPITNMAIVVIASFLGALVISYILRLIPFLRKKVL